MKERMREREREREENVRLVFASHSRFAIHHTSCNFAVRVASEICLLCVITTRTSGPKLRKRERVTE